MRLPLGRRVFVATALSKFHCLIRLLKLRGSHLVFFHFIFSQTVICSTFFGDDRTSILLRRDCGSLPQQ
jgi:hypothetical protein